MSGVTRSISGSLHYTSGQAGREGQERGRETFRLDYHPDGSRVLSAHSEIDDAPPVVRDVNLRQSAAGTPSECFVRIAVGGEFRGSAWFVFHDDLAECEAFTTLEGRVSQQIRLREPVPAFGNHAMINDGQLCRLYDLSQGPGVQVIPRLLLSSPDHRGATGPQMFAVDLALEYVGDESITVLAGDFAARHFRMVDVPGLPQEHPPYDLWVTADDDAILLRAAVGGYMETRYELASLQHWEPAR